MLKVDMSNVWGELSLPDMLAAEPDVFAAHQTAGRGQGRGATTILGWLDLPV